MPKLNGAGPAKGSVTQPARVRELDLFRFVAALAVVLYHYTYNRAVLDTGAAMYPVLERFTVHGYLGVDLFFMISGFVILWTARARRPSDFVISRITRLYPEFWISVILSASVFAMFPLSAGQRITLPMVFANLTMVPQLFRQPYVDNVYWTLFVELKFYLLLWLLSVAGQMRRIEPWIFGWLAVATYCFAYGGPHVFRSLTLHPYGPFFIGGCLFFLVRSDRLTVARAAGLLLCLGLGVVSAVEGMEGFVQAADITSAARIATGVIIVACFASFLLIATRVTDSSIAHRLAFLGALTYPLYLLHNIAKAVMLSIGGELHPYAQLAIAGAFSLALASVMVLVIERRMRRPFTEFLTRRYRKLATLVAAGIAERAARRNGL